MKFDILNRFTGAVQFSAEIECSEDAPPSIKLGLAVRVAVKARANLAGAYLAGAYLARANLADANLAGAYLVGAKWRDGITIQRAPLYINGLHYRVIILDAHMQIGCELHRLSEWEAFDNERIAQMDGKASRKFWDAWKAPLLAMARADGRDFTAQTDAVEAAAE